MEESEDNMSSEDIRNPSSVKKPKKRSMVERELETNLTARVTSPAVTGDGLSTSRYGRARRLKTDAELIESQKILLASIKSPGNENSPGKVQSPVYRMHASNSPHKSKKTPKKEPVTYLDNQIDNIYQENISLSRFSEETGSPSPAKKFPKVYIRKDLIQNREEEETIMLIKNLFSPTDSATKSTHLSDSSLNSTEKYNKQNGYIDNSSVVKTLDFDSNKKKKKDDREQKSNLSKNELFELEAKCPYQVGDLAWARMGTFPFWPCIVTRDPQTEMFVKKKLFGRVERDIIHVTFFGDNGRRSWIVDNMLRSYLGQLEFEATRDKFTPEDKKKDPKLYAAFFISEKKQALWNTSVEEAECLLREPKRLRIDIFYDMLWKSRASKKPLKSGKISSRTNSDVSLSESLYDSLFSEKDVKTDDAESTKNTRNVSDVVTACLDNMAAKTGITKIQRQSHMDRWLQKAKSKTPEKTQAKTTAILKVDKPEKSQKKSSPPIKLNRKSSVKSNAKPVPSTSQAKPYRFRKRTESQPKLTQDNNTDSNIENTDGEAINGNHSITKTDEEVSKNDNLNETVNDHKSQKVSPAITNEDDLCPKNEVAVEGATKIVNDDITAAAVIKQNAEDNNMTNSTVESCDKDLEISQTDVDKTNSIVNDVSSDEKNTENTRSLENKSVELTTDDTATCTISKNTSSLESNTLPVEDINHPETIEKHVSNMDSTDFAAEANNSIPFPNVSCQDNLMEVDETSDDGKTIQDNSIKASECAPKNDSPMDVDENVSMEGKAEGDLSRISETVSNECVEDNNVAHLKEAKNVTIEVSVAEKKKDNAINNLQDDEEPDSTEKLTFHSKEPKVKTLHFLEKINTLSEDFEAKDVISKNSSTPEKCINPKRRNPKFTEISAKKLNLENNIDSPISEYIFREEKILKTDKFSNNVPIENGISADECNENNENDVFNESGTSESILQHCSDNLQIEKGDETSKMPSDNAKPEHFLEITPISENSDRNIPLTENTENTNELSNGTELIMNDENSSSRHYVESPTFTQQDDIDFFRELNEKHNSPKELKENNKRQSPIPEKITADEIEKVAETVESNLISEDFDEYDESTSEDEPSPEYESLDDEITEDFRKHLESIENNIKDKKDDELIVKICNEIAEKAKLSPTKYTQDEEVYQSKVSKQLDVRVNKKDTTDSGKCNRKLVDSHDVKDGKNVNDGTDVKDGKNVNDRRNSSKILNQCKELSRSDKKKLTDIEIDPNSGNKTKINGNAASNEIPEPKVVYRTRSSVGGASKERSSPDVKIKSSKVEQARMSCEYEPKVMIIRLERDRGEYSIETRTKQLGVGSNIIHDPSVPDSLNDKEAESKTTDNEENKNSSKKSRLSLRRSSPRSRNTDNHGFKNQFEIKQDRSEDRIEDRLKNELKMTITKVPKKIDIKNNACETRIPEPVMNGYHNLDRKFADTPELAEDTDFDVDAVSLSSEDSEVSLPNSVENIPKRNLRSRTDTLLKNALENPKFLMYLELKQDYLMELHPELNEDEVLSYVFKTWQYEQELLSETKKEKQETPSRSKKSKKSLPKSAESSFIENSDTPINTSEVDAIGAEVRTPANSVQLFTPKESLTNLTVESTSKTETPKKQKRLSKSSNETPIASKDSESNLTKEKCKEVEPVPTIIDNETISTPKRSSRSRTSPKRLHKELDEDMEKSIPKLVIKIKRDVDTDSIASEDSEIPLRQLRSRAHKENHIEKLTKETTAEKKDESTASSEECNTETPTEEPNKEFKDETDETASTISDNEPLVKQKKKRIDKNFLQEPGFIQYLEKRRDTIMDENPQLTEDEIVEYLHKTWIYEENSKDALKKVDELEVQANLVKGLNNNEVAPPKQIKRKPKVDKHEDKQEDLVATPKDKPRRRAAAQAFYNENYSDIEDEIEVFEIFKMKKSTVTAVSKPEKEKIASPTSTTIKEVDASPKTPQAEQVQLAESEIEEVPNNVVDETEIYFEQLTKPKPNVFKGLVREKICEICECVGNLIKCKGCYGMFHPECDRKQSEPVAVERDPLLPKGRKKKRKSIRKLKDDLDGDSKSLDLSADASMEDVPPELCAIDAEYFESQLEAKMKELLSTADDDYCYSSDEGSQKTESIVGRCEIVDVRVKRRPTPVDYADFKCHSCVKHDAPVCFVCKAITSKSGVSTRQKCQVAHCHKVYHLECLEHWPQTQFVAGEGKREALWCPRHVCHSCVSDDPRCSARFSGDKLARCARCPATYHAYNRCVPAGSRLLTASHVVCPRHTEHKAGRVPCHVNTGWCFICAQGGSLICCEYCPTSFHAECLNIDPPEGNYMCEECETGRLPLYGEMVWVKLGQYRWWPGMILHPSEIPDNIMCAKHELGDFVVRFFGQYDHYWVNRGRVFPYQEGDSGRISSNKSKINADFILAIEHAQRAYAILKTAPVDAEESQDIEQSLLPPHYVKLKSNKGPHLPALAPAPCDCDPARPHPCGPHEHCLNRLLLTECGPWCRAGERCENRAFERRLYPRLQPYRTPHRGWGLRTLEDIRAGQFVIEYVGELIDEAEFQRRMRRKHEVRDENYYFLTLDKERVIDAGPKGNVARFMNHCCEPNCETQKWTVLGDVRVGLFALRDIPANSEVTFNYNLECTGIDKKQCLCGAPRCSGYIGAKPKQEESQSKKGKIKRAYNKKKKPEESPSTSKAKKKLGRPPKPKELTDLEKDVLIIKNATSTSSDEASKTEDKLPTSKRKTISTTTETTKEDIPKEKEKSLKRKRVSNSTEEVVCNGHEPSVKKLKCDKPSEVGD